MSHQFNETLIDSHCHLDFPVFDSDRKVILNACQKQSITAIVVPGVCRKNWQRVLTLCKYSKMLYPALGLHPCFIDEHHKGDLQVLAQLCQTEPLTAIGEIGLDFFITSDPVNKKTQEYFFSEQLQVASQYQLPVLIHARKSHAQVIKYLKTYNASSASASSIRGIIHAYSGSYEEAKEYLKLGFKLGFGGAYTYPKATKLRSLVSKLPIEAWVLETDAPDMSPLEQRDQRNSPQNLHEIAQIFMQLFHSEPINAQIIEQLYQNTLDVLTSIR